MSCSEMFMIYLNCIIYVKFILHLRRVSLRVPIPIYCIVQQDKAFRGRVGTENAHKPEVLCKRSQSTL
jgi:hypothetical protein